MGTIKRGVLGGFSGKVANVVGGSWKGIATMRSLPLSVANPRTAGQVAQRTKMSSLVLLAKLILSSIIKPLNDRFASRMSGYNRWVSFNVPAVSDDGLIDYLNLKIAEGSLEPVPIVTFDPNMGGDGLILTWVDNSGTGSALASDVVYATLFHVNTQELLFSGVIGVRSTVTFEFDNVPLASGHSYVVVVALLAADGRKSSNSIPVDYNM